MAGETIVLPVSVGGSSTSGFDVHTLEESEMLNEIKNLNENIKGLKEVVGSLSELLNSLIEGQERLSEKQELMEMDMIYEKYGKPLEKDHKGEFACITPDGEAALGKDSIDALKKADEKGLEDCILFKIGGTIDL